MEGDLGDLLQGEVTPILIEIGDGVLNLLICLYGEMEDRLGEGGVAYVVKVSLTGRLGEVLDDLDRYGKEHHLIVHKGRAFKKSCGARGHSVEASVNVASDREVYLVILVGVVVGGVEAARGGSYLEDIDSADRIVACEGGIVGFAGNVDSLCVERISLKSGLLDKLSEVVVLVGIDSLSEINVVAVVYNALSVNVITVTVLLSRVDGGNYNSLRAVCESGDSRLLDDVFAVLLLDEDVTRRIVLGEDEAEYTCILYVECYCNSRQRRESRMSFRHRQ